MRDEIVGSPDTISLQIFCEADLDTCLSRRRKCPSIDWLAYGSCGGVNPYLFLVLRDVKERGRDVEGCIKQWFAFVKPNFEKVWPGHRFHG